MNKNAALRCLDTPLPEEIARLKAAGYYAEAIAYIDGLLAEDWTRTQSGGHSPDKAENPQPALPRAMRLSLLAHREMMTRMEAEYPNDEAAALTHVQQRIPDMTLEEFRALVRDGRIDWRFVNGKKHFARRFVETLIYTDDTFALRAGTRPDYAARARRGEQAAMLQQMGSRAARIKLKYRIQAGEEAFAAAMAKAKADGRSAVRAKIWLPVPAAGVSQQDIVLEHFSVPPVSVAAETAPQRTAYWALELTENTPVEAVYAYTRTARYVDPLAEAACPAPACPAHLDPADFLGECAPHVRFTPAMRALVAEVVGDAADPAEKASRIYDYITLNVKYRFMPQYFVLEDIAGNCVRSRRGDCGVQAIAFVTMCRIAGIPAAWESGLSVTPGEGSCHDWAIFWLADKGWLYADCSFGGACARRGEEALRRHYFGSLDTDRMAANCRFQAPLTPPKQSWRADPYDNQLGEIELEGEGLSARTFDTTITVEQYDFL